MVFALGLALVSAAILGRSVLALRLARADFARTQEEFALDGAHLLAVAEIIRSTRSPPYHWTLTTDLGFAEVWATREADKLSPEAAGLTEDDAFKAFGVSDVAGLKAKLASAPLGSDLGPLDEAPLWRTCGDRFVSTFGRARQFHYVTASTRGSAKSRRPGGSASRGAFVSSRKLAGGTSGLFGLRGMRAIRRRQLRGR